MTSYFEINLFKGNYFLQVGLVIRQNSAHIIITLSHKVRHDNFQIN